MRSDLLYTLAEIMVEQAHCAAMLYREVLDPPSGAGDLALVLFELGEANEACELEKEASRTMATGTLLGQFW